VPDINPWGLISVLATVEALLFAFFLWRTAVPTPVTRRFTVLLLVEITTLLTSDAGVWLLFNHQFAPESQLLIEYVHHFGDVLMLILYPTFVAYALPLKMLKPLSGAPGRFFLFATGSIVFFWMILSDLGILHWRIEHNTPIYLALCIMFIVIFVFSVIAVNQATTKLGREKALAFVVAFGIRDLAWAGVYFAALMGWAERAPVMILLLYAGSTVLYIPIVTYGILKLQWLDIEIRLETTISNTLLAGGFIAAFYVISESVNNFISNRLGDILGFAVCALLAIFLSPLHRWANRVAARLVNTDADSPRYVKDRGVQVYSAAVEEVLAYGEIGQGQIALLDRLKQSLRVSDADARKVEMELRLDRAAISG